MVDSKGVGGLANEIVEEPAVMLHLRVKKGITTRLEMGQWEKSFTEETNLEKTYYIDHDVRVNV